MTRFVVSHHLTKDEAVKRVKTLLEEVKSQFADEIGDLREVWRGGTGEFSFKAMGFSVSGFLTVSSSGVEFSSNLPVEASFFRKKIEPAIRERAETLLA